MRRYILHLTIALLTFSIGLFSAIVVRNIQDKSLPCYDPRTSPTVTGIGRKPCEEMPAEKSSLDINEPAKDFGFDNPNCGMLVKNIRDFPSKKIRKAKRRNNR